MMNLETKLAEIRANSAANYPAEIQAGFARGIKELSDSGLTERALGLDSSIPGFNLENTESEWISSAKLLERGPLVVTFYRGVW
jgi:hypothetical protein